MKKSFLWIVFGIGGLILLFAVLLPLLLPVISGSSAKYTVNKTPFTFLNVQQTQKDLKTLADDLSQRTVTLTYKDHSVTLTGGEMSASYDVEATATEIDTYFNARNPFQKFYACYLKDPNFVMQIQIDSKAVLNAIYPLGYREENPQGYASYRVEGETLRITPGSGKDVVDEISVLELVREELGEQKGNPISIDEVSTVKMTQITEGEVLAYVGSEPQNATFSETENKIIPHQNGIAIKEGFDFNNLKLIPGGEDIIIPLVITVPEITTETLEKNLFRDLLGTHTSTYNPGAANRSHNVWLAASKINGRIFNQNAVFSYNEMVGPRTTSAGFKDAAVYVGNKVEQGIGGGICQVSSALYAAAVKANLAVVERTNHSMPVSYMVPGTDATVSYGSLDLRLKNNTPYPIRIEASAKGGNMTVNIYGTRIDTSYDEIVLVNECVSSTPYTVIEQPSSYYKVGETNVIQNGSNGGVYRLYQQFRKEGKTVKTVLTNKSTYAPTPKIVQVGTVPVEVVAPAEPVAPTPPTQPTVPVGPAVPLDPVPTEPTLPSKPVESITPVLPDPPSEIVLPVEPTPSPDPMVEATVQI